MPNEIPAVDPFPHIFKPKRLFSVTFNERFALAGNHRLTSGPHFPIVYEGRAIEVYGLANKKEADGFDSANLKKSIRGSRETRLFFSAGNKKKLLRKVKRDPSVVAGSWKLVEYKSIPQCPRMHIDMTTGETLCGKPVNGHGDGCLGRCIISGQDRDFSGCDFKCPIQMARAAEHQKSLRRSKTAFSEN